MCVPLSCIIYAPAGKSCPSKLGEPGTIIAQFYDTTGEASTSPFTYTEGDETVSVQGTEGCYCSCCKGAFCSTQYASSYLAFAPSQCTPELCFISNVDSCPDNEADGRVVATFYSGGQSANKTYYRDFDYSPETKTPEIVRAGSNGIGGGAIAGLTVLIVALLLIVIASGKYFHNKLTKVKGQVTMDYALINL